MEATLFGHEEVRIFSAQEGPHRARRVVAGLYQLEDLQLVLRGELPPLRDGHHLRVGHRTGALEQTAAQPCPIVRPRFVRALPATRVSLRAAVDPAYAARLRDPGFQAAEQRTLLEQVGGAAVPLGQPGGRGADCLRLLNQAVSDVGMRFVPRFVVAPGELDRDAWRSQLFCAVVAATAAGYPVPLGLGPTDGETEHFVLALESELRGGEPHLLLFNPADGSCSWRSLGWLMHPRLGFTPTQTHLTVAYLPSHGS